jgi:hypothetical protein
VCVYLRNTLNGNVLLSLSLSPCAERLHQHDCQ